MHSMVCLVVHKWRLVAYSVVLYLGGPSRVHVESRPLAWPWSLRRPRMDLVNQGTTSSTVLGAPHVATY